MQFILVDYVLSYVRFINYSLVISNRNSLRIVRTLILQVKFALVIFSRIIMNFPDASSAIKKIPGGKEDGFITFPVVYP